MQHASQTGFLIGVGDDLAEILREFGNDHQLHGVFCSAPPAILASGRINDAPPMTLDELERRVEMAHNNPHHPVRFNLALNAFAVGFYKGQGENRYMVRDGDSWKHDERITERFHNFFDFLVRSCVDTVTIANPALMSIACAYRAQYRKTHGQDPFELAASTFFDIHDIMAFESVTRMFTVDTAHLYQSVNRDFYSLQRIRTAAENRKIDLVLYASTGSLFLCPYRFDHRALIAQQCGTYAADFCKQWCINEREKDPFLIFTAPTIPPEAIHIYEGLGYRRFKLAGRDMSTAWRKKNLRRYLERKTEAGAGIADLCDTNMGRKMPYISISSVVSFIEYLRHLDYTADQPGSYMDVAAKFMAGANYKG